MFETGPGIALRPARPQNRLRGPAPLSTPPYTRPPRPMSQNLLRGLLVFGLVLLLGAEVQAQNSPVGKWRTIDETTGQARSVVEIVRESDGTYSGYIRELTDPARRNAVCEVCPADWGHGQRIVGLKMVRNVRERGGNFEGGQILNPEDGKVYSVRFNPIDGGQRLEVRGFMRVPLMGSALGRTQTWIRVE
jgi:uncharacterized protein (DUF2147 family)